MKEIKLSQGLVALIDDEDYNIINQYKWHAAFDKRCSTFYAIRNVLTEQGNNTTERMHRVIMGVKNKQIKIDHINHNGLHNHRSNLRIANDSQSMANRRSHKNSTSEYLGVHWRKDANKWRAMIMKNGKPISIGHFENEIDAATAYNDAAILIHGEFANLNKITA